MVGKSLPRGALGTYHLAPSELQASLGPIWRRFSLYSAALCCYRFQDCALSVGLSGFTSVDNGRYNSVRPRYRLCEGFYSPKDLVGFRSFIGGRFFA
jgi:hypothetical protein